MAKAIGAGADFVMLGGMLAGHDQVNCLPIQRSMEIYSLRDTLLSSMGFEPSNVSECTNNHHLVNHRRTHFMSKDVPHSSQFKALINHW